MEVIRGALCVGILMILVAMAVMANQGFKETLPCEHVRVGRLYYFVPTGDVVQVVKQGDLRHAEIDVRGSVNTVECRQLTSTANVYKAFRL